MDGQSISLNLGKGVSHAAAPPSFRRVQRLFLWIAVVLCIVVVVDNVSFKPMTGISIKGADYLFLSLAGAFLIITALKRGLARSLAASVVTIVLVLALLETGLGLWSLTQPRRSPWYVWPPNYACLMQPANLPGVAKTGRFSTNSLGIRGPEFTAADSYRILCVGGSATECLYLDDAKTWPAQLMELLRRGTPGVWVGNVGLSGTVAAHHVLLLSQLPEAKRVDCWVVLCGLNDFGHQIFGTYDDMVARASVSTFKYRRPGPGGQVRRPLQRNLYTFALAETVCKRLAVALKGEKATVYQDVRAAWVQEQQQMRQDEAKITVPLKPPWIEEYRTQLRRIVEEARQRSKRLIFMTQPTLWTEQMDERTEGLTLGGQLANGQYADNLSRRKAMERYNQVMRDLAAEAGIELVDLAGRLPKTTEAFYDDCHFNENGARLVAEALAEQVTTRELKAGARQ